MIIVSQDGLKIVNIDNIDEISYEQNFKRIKAFASQYSTTLGHYSSENQAKKILIDIAKTDSCVVKASKYNHGTVTEEVKYNTVYQMPKDKGDF